MSSLLDDLDDLGSGDEQDDVSKFSKPTTLTSSSSASAAAKIGDIAAAFRPAGSSSANDGGMADDLNDLSDDDGDEDDDEADGDDVDGNAASRASNSGVDDVQQEEKGDAQLDSELAAMKGRTGFRAVARLRDTSRFKEHMVRVEAALASTGVPEVVGMLEEWPEYKLIVASNALINSIDEEHIQLHAYIVAAYAPKFPELANILPNAGDYIRVVKAIGNETDMTLVDALPSLLPSAQVMVVTVTGSVTDGRPLQPAALADVLAACDEVLALEASKARILSFVESRMMTLAPNMSVLLGTAVAARLMGIAGGLGALARIPANNMACLGQKRRTLAGFSNKAGVSHVGVVFDCDLVQGAPSSYRRKIVNVLAGKVVLAARVDSFRERPDGSLGGTFREYVATRTRKMQEPPPGKTKRPLPAPDDKPSKKRGGRRARKLKEKLGLTDVRREAGRLTFATTSSEYSDLSMGRDSGRLGEGGGGRLRIERKEQKIVSKKRKFEQTQSGYLGGSSGATGGMASSMAFTPGQGLALYNPAAAQARAAKASESAGYFSSTGSFSVIKKS